MTGGVRAGALAIAPAAVAAAIALGAGCAQPSPDERAACAVARPAVVEAAGEVAGGAAPAPGDPERGAALFARECAGCHAPHLVDRGSRFFRGYPRLDCPTYRSAVTASYLYGVISEGGEAYGLDDAMKGFADALSVQERRDLVAHLLAGP